MAISLHTNNPASRAYLGLEKANDLMKKSLNRLSSGQRIASIADDAGGLSVAYKIKSKLVRNEQVVKNLANASSFLDLQQGALGSVGNILSRMSELKTMSLDVTKNPVDTENYNKEFKELQHQLEQIFHQNFNDVSLFSNQIPKVLFGDAVGLELLKQSADDDASGIKRVLDSVYDLKDFDMSDFESFIQALSNALAVNGAESQAVDFKVKELNQTFFNTEKAHGRIMDADISLESTRFAKQNVLLQPSATMMFMPVNLVM